MKVLNVVGARPNFMKIGPIISAFRERSIEQLLVHTGQHYDRQLSGLFFEELELPPPDVNLGVGSGSHAVQTAEIMKKFEAVCLEQNPSHVLVVGDVNSTIACALVAVKLGIRTVHVEAGLRSFDRSMPEEINRILTDAISDLLFTTEESANDNLRREGIPEAKIHFVGNVMIDNLLRHRQQAERSDILGRLGLGDGGAGARPYGVLTLHRAATVDDQHRLAEVVGAVSRVSRDLPIVFPVHPRTRGRMTTGSIGRAGPGCPDGRSRSHQGGKRHSCHSAARLPRLPAPDVARTGRADGFGRHPGGNDHTRCSVRHPAGFDGASRDGHAGHERARGRRGGRNRCEHPGTARAAMACFARPASALGWRGRAPDRRDHFRTNEVIERAE